MTTFLVVGVGGLGAPVATALARARAGRLVLVDPDAVELSNLQRQVLYRTADVGRPKVLAARDALGRRGFHDTETHALRIDEATGPDLIAAADVVIEGTDSLDCKFLVNDLCQAAGRGFVIGGVLGHEGQVLAIRPGVDACYRCLFESPPSEPQLTCADAGVLGALCGVVAAVQVRVALALAGARAVGPAGILGRVHLVHEGHVRTISPRRRPGCPACARVPARAAALSPRSGQRISG